MSLLISHRGNTTGARPENENTIEHVQEALNKGFHVMVNVWLVGTSYLALGNHRAQYQVELSWLKKNNIICQAMTVNTFEFLLANEIHCFLTAQCGHKLTNGGLIWTIGDHVPTPRAVIHLPEWFTPEISVMKNVKCAGICSNRIQTIRDARDTEQKSPETPLTKLS